MTDLATPVPGVEPMPASAQSDTTTSMRLIDLLPQTPSTYCWLCSAKGVTGVWRSQRNTGGWFTATVCEDGTGCRDGRIFHGPNGPNPHLPGEPCEVCGGSAGQVVIPRPRSTRNRGQLNGGAW